MGRSSASVLLFSLAALAILGLSACGSGDGADLLPGDTASEITANLDQVKELANAGDCVGAEAAAEAVSTQIEELGGVDAKLKQALREGATRLNEVVAGCEEAAPEEETAPAIEPAEELDAEKPEKSKPEKPAKPEKEAVEPPEETSPTLPPQAEGKAKGHEKQEEAPPVEPEPGSPSGGVGPSEPAAE